MSFDEDKVSIIRFHSGEEIIALVVSRDDKETKVKLPFQIGMAPDQQGGVKVHLAPFLPLSNDEDDAEIPFPEKIIAFPYKPSKDIIETYKKIYIKMTSSLILPNNPSGIINP